MIPLKKFHFHCKLFCFIAVQADKAPPAVKTGGKRSISEQIAGVIRQPAFIAGLGVAAWVVLMGFSGWLYCRHHRRKQLGHYTTSFAYTPAGEREQLPLLSAGASLAW